MHAADCCMQLEHTESIRRCAGMPVQDIDRGLLEEGLLVWIPQLASAAVPEQQCQSAAVPEPGAELEGRDSSRHLDDITLPPLQVSSLPSTC